MRKYDSLFVLYNLYNSSSNLKQIEKKKHWKTILAEAKHFTSSASNSTWEVLHGRLCHA